MERAILSVRVAQAQKLDLLEAGMAWDLTAFRCPTCGSEDGFRSRRRSFADKYVLPFLLLKPVRCEGCSRRFYRPLFTVVRMRHPRFYMSLAVQSLRVPGTMTSPD